MTIVCSDDKVQFIFEAGDGNQKIQMNKFIENLKNFNGKYQEINDDKISEDEYILGRDDKRWYLVKNLNKQISNLFQIVGNSLIGILCFYGTNFEVIIQLVDNLTVKYCELDGFICD